jgi:hypothetical protein
VTITYPPYGYNNETTTWEKYKVRVKAIGEAEYDAQHEMEAENMQYQVKAFDEGWALGLSQGHAEAVCDLTRTANNRRIDVYKRAARDL